MIKISDSVAFSQLIYILVLNFLPEFKSCYCLKYRVIQN